MYIQDSYRKPFGSFQLEMDKIENVSKNNGLVELPYTGKLPDPYHSARLRINVSPCRTSICLIASTDTKRLKRYAVEATREEIDSILWPFFWERNQEPDGAYTTRFNNGLSKYWNGVYQTGYMDWHNFNRIPTQIIDVIKQLSPGKRKSFYRMLEQMRREEQDLV